jgi:hypothetical protein
MVSLIKIAQNSQSFLIINNRQFLLYRENDKVYAQLKKVDLPIDDFLLDLSIKTRENEVNRRYDAKYFYDTWFYVHTLEYNYVSCLHNTRVAVLQDSFVMKIKVNYSIS